MDTDELNVMETKEQDSSVETDIETCVSSEIKHENSQPDHEIIQPDEEPETEIASVTEQKEVLTPPEIFFTEKLEEVRESLQHLSDIFQSKMRYDAHKEKIIDKLHSELQDYKSDLVKQCLNPIVMDIIMLRDDLKKMTDHYQALDPADYKPEKLLNLFDKFIDELEDILYRQGAESFSSSDDFFNPKIQRVVQSIPTENETLDKKVAERIRPGYEWENRILRKELVNVYVYRIASNEKGELNE